MDYNGTDKWFAVGDDLPPEPIVEDGLHLRVARIIVIAGAVATALLIGAGYLAHDRTPTATRRPTIAAATTAPVAAIATPPSAAVPTVDPSALAKVASPASPARKRNNAKHRARRLHWGA